MSRFLRPILLVGLVLIPSLSLAQQASEETFWWNDRVFYEIFVRSFHDSDGDGIGDLRGVIEKLDYLNDGDPTTTTDLGVTGIWLMPIMESPSYHGYDVTDYRRIEPDYGSLADFRALMREAHARGIAVIIDMVINHTSVQHPWFAASTQGEAPYNGWYVWANENPGFRGPDSQTVWHERQGRWYYALFWDGMPDLNLRTSAVTQELYDIANVWLNVVGVDGFRLDAIKHLVEEGRNQESTRSTLTWMAQYNDYIDSIAPDALLVGEVWESNFIASQYVPEQVDLVFDFDYAAALITSLEQGRPDSLDAILDRAANIYPPGQFATFITNHDQNRYMSALRGDVDQARIAASLLLTTPGVPFVYYGEEIGMTGVKPDERIRTPMRWDESATTAGFTTADRPWQPLSEDGAGISTAAQTDDPDSLLSHYRALIQLRHQYPALARGSYARLEIEESPNAYAFIRETDDETILVLMNMNDSPISGYALALDSTPDLLYGWGADGGIDSYTPGDALDPFSTLVLRLR
ncbi:MAG: alpha-amylase family glycosyl hydrolase [bacterium]|nr:alpha-amylase family glycosyl hydrolase [bacterium]